MSRANLLNFHNQWTRVKENLDITSNFIISGHVSRWTVIPTGSHFPHKFCYQWSILHVSRANLLNFHNQWTHVKENLDITYNFIISGHVSGWTVIPTGSHFPHKFRYQWSKLHVSRASLKTHVNMTLALYHIIYDKQLYFLHKMQLYLKNYRIFKKIWSFSPLFIRWWLFYKILFCESPKYRVKFY